MDIFAPLVAIFHAQIVKENCQKNSFVHELSPLALGIIADAFGSFKKNKKSASLTELVKW